MERSVIFSVHDLKLYPLTDPTVPTYGAPVDVPAVSELSMDPEMARATLRGDGKIVDQRTTQDEVSISFTFGKQDPDVMAITDGGTRSENAAGTITRYVRTAADVTPEFGLACLVSEVDEPGGAAKLYMYRGKISGGSLFGASDNEYGQPGFDVAGIPLDTVEVGEEAEAMWALDLEDVGSALPISGALFKATRLALV